MRNASDPSRRLSNSKREVTPSKRPTARYHIEAELACGGMGIVYRVLDRTAGQTRAMKRANMEAGNRDFVLKAFEREYHVLASLDHPRIIRVFDYGVDELGPFYTMGLLEGRDMREAAPLPFKQACFYLRDVATSLALLHARRLIHRDLSPSNIRMTEDGHCKLLDFGALTSFGHAPIVVGTPPAVPPEALKGEPLDQRADLYSLGALAYWMLTGKHAYPARHIEELSAKWNQPLAAPSAYVPDIPNELDSLVLSLLCSDPLARPTSAAEVIAKLEVIAELPQEFTTQTERLAQSFLLSPRFTGRKAELEQLGALIEGVAQGRGSAVRIHSVAGMGRTRLLDEISVRGQLAGVTVIRADASMYRRHNGIARALAVRLYEAIPELAREHSKRFRPALVALGPEVEAHFVSQPPAPLVRSATPSATLTVESVASLDGWFAELSSETALMVLVDNVEFADDASLGLLASLAKLSADHPLLLVVTERLTRETRGAIGLVTLGHYCQRLELLGLNTSDFLDLLRSLFADAPNVERFAEWLFERTAGSPLYAVEICRHLVATQVIRYAGGIWTLPTERPDTELPPALGDALSIRLAGLGEEARSLAECLSLQRQQPTLELCRLLSPGASDREVLQLLDELARNDVIYSDNDGYRFSSTALRESLLSGMDEARLEQNHRRLGEAFTTLAGRDNLALRIEAGWHLIQGGDEVRGSDIIANVAVASIKLQTLIANLHEFGEPLEAALKVYQHYRRSIYERLPILIALAHAGYYEQRAWSDHYGDQALDLLEVLSGLRTAKRLTPFIGRWLGLCTGIFTAYIRYMFIPRRERRIRFGALVRHFLGVVTILTGTAALSLDPERAARIAQVLDPLAVLPDRFAAAGVYQFCQGLKEIGKENAAEAYDIFDRLISRLQDPHYYSALRDSNFLYLAGAHFARASFAIFRAHGQAALESADALDRIGLKTYAMIASQLRYLYYTIRGEFAEAAPHREQVELHAAHVGSVWQVETWDAAALILVHLSSLSDIVASTRLVHRLELLSRTIPSLKRYSRIARQSLMLARRETRYTSMVESEYEQVSPRSFIGWAATMAQLGRGYNEVGKHAAAKAVCERALVHVSDRDREYVALFSGLEIELAIALAGVGRFSDGLAVIDRLIERFSDCEHPILHGLLHEARARIAWSAGMSDQYAISLAEVERNFRLSGSSALIAKYDRLAQLRVADPSYNALVSTSTRPTASALTEELLIEDIRETEIAVTSQEQTIVDTHSRRPKGPGRL